MQRFQSLLAAPVAALILVGGSLVQPAAHTHADETWCWDDPVVSVNGHLLDIKVEQPVNNVLTQRSTAVTVIIPRNVSGSVVLDDVSAFPMKTTIAATGPSWNGKGSVPVTIVSTVTASTNYPVKVTATPALSLIGTVMPPATATGTANSPLTLAYQVGG